jgi:RNA polymerase sigma factor (TIGR02999 family)
MSDKPRTELTGLLLKIKEPGGDNLADANRVFELVYDELREMAGNLMRMERSNHTLQPTALVHEAYTRLIDQSQLDWQCRAHFFGIAGRAMRQVLVDHARSRGAAKRGGDLRRVTLETGLGGQGETGLIEVLALDETLGRLAELDERMARVVELRVFGGLTAEEVGQALGVSRRTVQEDWRVARMWLAREFGIGTEDEESNGDTPE